MMRHANKRVPESCLRDIFKACIAHWHSQRIANNLRKGKYCECICVWLPFQMGFPHLNHDGLRCSAPLSAPPEVTGRTKVTRHWNDRRLAGVDQRLIGDAELIGNAFFWDTSRPRWNQWSSWGPEATRADHVFLVLRWVYQIQHQKEAWLDGSMPSVEISLYLVQKSNFWCRMLFQLRSLWIGACACDYTFTNRAKDKWIGMLQIVNLARPYLSRWFPKWK